MSLIHIARNNAVLGQFTEDEVRAGLADGTYLRTDLAWKAGRKNWEPLSAWEEFAAVGSTPPPVPSAEDVCAKESKEGPHPASPAWERENEAPPVTRYFMSVKEVLTKPTETFAGMPKSGGIMRPLAFYLSTQIPTAILMSCAAGLFTALASDELVAKRPEAKMLHELGAPAAAAGYFAFLAIACPAGLFLLAALYHGMLKLWGVRDSGYETTFRVSAYVSGSIGLIMLPFSLLSMVPVIGQLMGIFTLPLSLYSLVLFVIGLMKTHDAPAGRTIGAVLTPMIACCCCFGALAGFAAVAAVGAMHH